MKQHEKLLKSSIQSKFITMPGEEVILVQRKHWSVFIFPIIAFSILGAISIISLITLAALFQNYAFLSISLLLAISAGLISLVTKSIIDWYLNLYIVTNRKIIEVSYKPLSSRGVSEVLLDQVKCTEIDTQITGIVNDFLDVGDVVVTFDRPTHQDEFTFINVPDPRKVERYLENAFYTQKSPNSNVNLLREDQIGQSERFNKSRENSGKWVYTQEIKNGAFSIN